jgi:hypothetical protein
VVVAADADVPGVEDSVAATDDDASDECVVECRVDVACPDAPDDPADPVAPVVPDPWEPDVDPLPDPARASSAFRWLYRLPRNPVLALLDTPGDDWPVPCTDSAWMSTQSPSRPAAADDVAAAPADVVDGAELVELVAAEDGATVVTTRAVTVAAARVPLRRRIRYLMSRLLSARRSLEMGLCWSVAGQSIASIRLICHKLSCEVPVIFCRKVWSSAPGVDIVSVAVTVDIDDFTAGIVRQ